MDKPDYAKPVPSYRKNQNWIVMADAITHRTCAKWDTRSDIVQCTGWVIVLTNNNDPRCA
jgi:hypothetical protein